jgi:hypothetical protein
MTFAPLGSYPLGGFPFEEFTTAHGSSGRWIGRYGKVRRVEDVPLLLDIPPNEDFDLDLVVALWMTQDDDS